MNYNINLSLIDPLNCNIFHMKIIDKKYLNTINQLHFGCAKKYEENYVKEQNCGQGDYYEGCIARLKRGNKLIEEFKSKYNDLLIQDDIHNQQFVVLKRESSYHKPIYCFYSVNSKKANKIELRKLFCKRFPYSFYFELSQDEKIFQDFRGKNGFIMINLFNPSQIMFDLKKEHKFLNFIDVNIKYYKFSSNGEWICPEYKKYKIVNNYAELKYKNDSFEYQNERRFIITNIDMKDDNKFFLVYDKITNLDTKILKYGFDKLQIDTPLLQIINVND